MPAVRLGKLLLPVILAVALVSTACVGFSEPRGWAEPVFEGDTVYVFTDREEFVAVTLDDLGGQARWYFPDNDIDAEDDLDLEAVYGPPLFTGGRIILAAFSGEIVALSREGRLAPARGSWNRDDVKGSIVGGAVLAGDVFAFGTTEERFYVRSVVDGGAVPAWPLDGLKLKGEIWSQPVVVGSVLYVPTMDGNLYAFDLETGQELWPEPFDAGGAIPDLAFIEGWGAVCPDARGRGVAGRCGERSGPGRCVPGGGMGVDDAGGPQRRGLLRRFRGFRLRDGSGDAAARGGSTKPGTR